MFIEFVEENGNSTIIRISDIVEIYFLSNEFTIEIEYKNNKTPYTRFLEYKNQEKYNIICDSIRKQLNINK